MIQGEGWTLYKDDILSWCKTYTGPQAHACLCDPPYELGFMGKSWDRSGVAFNPETWAALAAHLLPGAFLFAFGGTRTYHRMAVAIEDAGFVLHPAIVWANGAGFPKSTGIPDERFNGHRYGRQALKPAAEFICVAQKPYAGRPLDSITQTGAGALSIDAGRIETNGRPLRGEHTGDNGLFGMGSGWAIGETTQGRWPANLLLSEQAAQRLDEMSGDTAGRADRNGGGAGGFWRSSNGQPVGRDYEDQGGASRFFYTVSDAIDAADPLYYCAKASRGEREAGLVGMPIRETWATSHEFSSDPRMDHEQNRNPSRNPHPTVKPLDLCRYLATLLLSPAEYAPRRLLVPFCGVASEMIGARLAGWDQVVGIDRDDENQYLEIARARLEYWTGKTLKGRKVSKAESMPLFAGVA